MVCNLGGLDYDDLASNRSPVKGAEMLDLLPRETAPFALAIGADDARARLFGLSRV